MAYTGAWDPEVVIDPVLASAPRLALAPEPASCSVPSPGAAVGIAVVPPGTVAALFVAGLFVAADVSTGSATFFLRTYIEIWC